MNLNSHFTTDIPETFTKAFRIRDHYVNVFGLVFHIPVFIRVHAVVMVITLAVQFGLKSVKGPVWIVAPLEASPVMLLLLTQ